MFECYNRVCVFVQLSFCHDTYLNQQFEDIVLEDRFALESIDAYTARLHLVLERVVHCDAADIGLLQVTGLLAHELADRL